MAYECEIGGAGGHNQTYPTVGYTFLLPSEAIVSDRWSSSSDQPPEHIVNSMLGLALLIEQRKVGRVA